MNARPAMIGDCLVETFVAELTAAVYSVALRHGPGERWLLGIAVLSLGDTVANSHPGLRGAGRLLN